jgi:hypothetical protein
MPDELTAIDPLGRTVYLPADFATDSNPNGVIDDVTAVIIRPAVLIEVKEKEETEYYYFRSVGWNKALLIITQLHNNRWEAYKFVWNPTAEMMSNVLGKGKQVV